MFRIFVCSLVLLFFPLQLQGCFEGEEDDEGNSGKNNSGITIVDSDPSSSATAQQGDNNVYSDNDSAEPGNSTEGSNTSLNTPPRQKESNPRTLNKITDLSKKIKCAQQDIDDLKLERREIQEEVASGFRVSFDERKNIAMEVRDTCEKWNYERQIYELSQREVKDEIDHEVGEKIHELLALTDSVFEESEQTLLLVFPERRVRDLFTPQIKKENSDAFSSSSPRSVASSSLDENEKGDSLSAKELEPPYSYHFPYTEFFQTKGELIYLQQEIERKEHVHREIMSHLAAEKQERDSAVKDFRKKHRFRLCSSAYPIIQDYQPRIEKAERSLAQEQKAIDELREMMGIHYQNVSYFADRIREEMPKEFELWKRFGDASNPGEDFTMFFNKKLRDMRDCFLKKDSRLSAADREKIRWEELLLEKRF